MATQVDHSASLPFPSVTKSVLIDWQHSYHPFPSFTPLIENRSRSIKYISWKCKRLGSLYFVLDSYDDDS